MSDAARDNPTTNDGSGDLPPSNNSTLDSNNAVATVPETPTMTNSTSVTVGNREAALQQIYSAFLLDVLRGRFSRTKLSENVQHVQTPIGITEPESTHQTSPGADLSGEITPAHSSGSSDEDLEEAFSYVVYPKRTSYRANHFVEFYIDGSDENVTIFRDPEEFLVAIFHPDGCRRVDVTTQLDQETAYRYICRFDTSEPGIYQGFVQLDCKSIPGSPINFSVSREYRRKPIRSIIYASPPRKMNETTLAHRLWGIDFDKQTEKIYVTDKSAHQVRAFSLDGRMLEVIGGPDLFQYPTGLAVDSVNRRILVADKENNRVCIWSTDGQFISSFGKLGSLDGEFDKPWGIDVSPNGTRIVVADSRNHRLQVFDKSGNFLHKSIALESNPNKHGFIYDHPRGVCFDNMGANIYCADNVADVIHRFNEDLSVISEFGQPGELKRPQGIRMDCAGNVLVCNSLSDNVKVFTPEGNKLAIMTANQKMHSPLNLAILPDGNVAMLDVSGKIYIC